MIIWLNGAFGSGKTSVSQELKKLNPDMVIFDPEDVGLFIRASVPYGDKDPDFQDHKLWRILNFEIIKHLSESQTNNIIIPMTITNQCYYEEIINKLREHGHDVQVYSLRAPKEIIHKRLLERGDAPDSWAFHQTDRCLAFLNNDLSSTSINTVEHNIKEVAKIILQDIANY